jgi:hypothetical protein
MPIDLDTLVAKPGFAPQAWQSKCPDDAHKTSGVAVLPSADLTRIAALPRRPRPTEEQAQLLIDGVPVLMGPMIDGVQSLRRDNKNCKCAALFEEYGMEGRPCITSLRAIQAWALLEARTQSGILGLIGVGHGKTFLDLLIPWAIPNCKTMLLLVPPKLIEQLDRDYNLLNEHFQLPGITFHSKKGESRVRPGRPTIHVLPYSLLQRPEFTTYVEQRIHPDLVVADEVHKLKNANTATTGRILRFYHAHPETRFCGWSGSLAGKSIKGYAHLSALALRHASPLPIHPDTVEDWARAIDPVTLRDKEGQLKDPAPMGALEILCNKGEHIRDAFRRRLVETPGVISTRAAAVGAKLIITERVPPPIPTVPTLHEFSVMECLRRLRSKWLRPDGLVYPDAMQRAAGALQISCGFHYRWKFPLVNGRPQDPELITEWMMRRSAWNSEVRKAIKSRKEHFDSECLARNAAERAWGQRPIHDKKLPVWMSESYMAWQEIEHKVVHETEAIWIDEWLARDAAEWAMSHRGIVWYAMRAFGEKVAQLSGCNLHGGGPDAGQLIMREDGKRSIIASIESHGTGRDGLQYKYDEQLIGNFPSLNEQCEQLLGRLHRDGQASEIVKADFYKHTPELSRAVNKALLEAGYVEETTEGEQKLALGGVELVDDSFAPEDLCDDEEE